MVWHASHGSCFPGIPHHVTRRGNRRMETFFCEEDYEAYLGLMAERCRHWGG